MKVFHGHRNLPAAARGAVVAIGNFDGVHRGHQRVIADAATLARTLDAPLCVMVFEPHPREVFRPDDPPFRLTPMPVRTRILAALGVDLHIVLPFDRAFSQKTAEAFVREVLVNGLAARHVLVGRDFHYGHKRRGDATTLEAAGRALGFGVTVVVPVEDETGEVYSSSRVRTLLGAGDPQGAARVLGRPWEIEGEVQKGDQRGRDLGYPTANIDLGPYHRPAFGIYAVRAATAAGEPRWIDGVANIGIRPMFRTDRPLVEAHLFDFSGDLYGQALRVQLVDYVREERRFDDIGALIDQMDADSAHARRALARRT
ncbi:MAG: bifunctional riboflavin kinase/FAD synthetase [Inquilinaceae bacterium]